MYLPHEVRDLHRAKQSELTTQCVHDSYNLTPEEWLRLAREMNRYRRASSEQPLSAAELHVLDYDCSSKTARQVLRFRGPLCDPEMRYLNRQWAA